MQNAFIFCNRKRDVALLFTSLKKLGFNVGALHGDMVQSKRTETLDAFKRGEISILVCSDVAARGLDISGMSHVFNFDVPFHAEDYVHRIGRTGRAGKSGIAYTLATEDDAKSIAAIEKLIKNPLQIMRAGATAAAPTAASEKSVTAPSEPHAQASPAESRARRTPPRAACAAPSRHSFPRTARRHSGAGRRCPRRACFRISCSHAARLRRSPACLHAPGLISLNQIRDARSAPLAGHFDQSQLADAEDFDSGRIVGNRVAQACQ